MGNEVSKIDPSKPRRGRHVETPFPPTVPRGGSTERIHAQIRTRLEAIAARPMESTFDLPRPNSERVTAVTTFTVTATNPPQLRATVVVTATDNVSREQRGQYQGQIRSNTTGMVNRALGDRDLARGYLLDVQVRWATRQ